MPCSAEEANETLHLSLSQQAMLWLQQGKAQFGLYQSGHTDRARNAGKVGAELEYAVYCMDEAIDRARWFTRRTIYILAHILRYRGEHARRRQEEKKRKERAGLRRKEKNTLTCCAFCTLPPFSLRRLTPLCFPSFYLGAGRRST